MRKLGGLALLGLSTVLASCNTSSRAPLPTQTQITGDIQTWSGPGTVTPQSSGPALQSVAVNADGTFVIPLPSAAQLSGKTQPVASTLLEGLNLLNCRNVSLTSSNGQAQGKLIFALQAQDMAGSRSVVAATLSTRNFTVNVSANAWLYVDTATTLQGRIGCSLVGYNLPVDVSINAEPGWNVISIDGSAGALSSAEADAERATSAPVQTWVTLEELRSQLPF
ncbi:hypothetical protein [Deinococcus sp. NW-56]|uniref:hypothetical protein n=1 Tax=Deinococcus sp. NW-56 TaxID=2080419 RepID=UPI00131A3D0F|nr:hypothetical protein [Deinococcus sp. NW-56]